MAVVHVATITPSVRRTLTAIAVAGALGVGGFLILPDLLGIRFGYTLRVVATGGALLGALSGLVGVFSVLRRQSLMGDALSHATLPGVAVAFLLVGRELWALMAGAAVAGWLGVRAIRVITERTRIKSDAAMGIVLAGWFALGIVGLTYAQNRGDAAQAGLDEFIFGQAASIVAADVRMITGVAAVACATLVILWKPLKLVTFDRSFARSAGIRVELLEGVLSGLTLLAIVMGLQIAGVVLMVSLLVAPGIGARQWTDHLWGMAVLAAIFGAIAGSFGAVVSASATDLPAGPMIVLVATSIVAISLLLSPRRGLIATALRRRGEERSLAIQTGLRDLYHYAWDHGGERAGVPDSFIAHVRGQSGRQALAALRARGLVRRVETGRGGSGKSDERYRWFLTESGIAAARFDVHNQKLWDLYRRTAGTHDIPLVPEQRDRDIRAVLPESSVEQLERWSGDGWEEPRVRS